MQGESGEGDDDTSLGLWAFMVNLVGLGTMHMKRSLLDRSSLGRFNFLAGSDRNSDCEAGPVLERRLACFNHVHDQYVEARPAGSD